MPRINFAFAIERKKELKPKVSSASSKLLNVSHPAIANIGGKWSSEDCWHHLACHLLRMLPSSVRLLSCSELIILVRGVRCRKISKELKQSIRVFSRIKHSPITKRSRKLLRSWTALTLGGGNDCQNLRLTQRKRRIRG